MSYASKNNTLFTFNCLAFENKKYKEEENIKKNFFLENLKKENKISLKEHKLITNKLNK